MAECFIIFGKKGTNKMVVKEGGGGKYQPYNEKDGRYCRNPVCIKDEETLVLKRLFGISMKDEISYPIPGVHDRQYLELIIAYGLKLEYPYIDDRKISHYLLVFKEKNDKSLFFNRIGYTLESWNNLKEAIIYGTSFKRKNLVDFDKHKFTFETETIIKNLITGEKVSLTSVWNVERDFTVRFITIIPKETNYSK